MWKKKYPILLEMFEKEEEERNYPNTYSNILWSLDNKNRVEFALRSTKANQ